MRRHARRTRRLRGRLLAALLVFAALAATACGSDDDDRSSTSADRTNRTTSAENESDAEITGGPGVDIDATTIRVASLSALSGPAEVLGLPLTAGQRIYFEALNAAGGIDGWTIEFEEVDTQYDPQIHKQAYAEVSGDVALISQSVGSPTTAAILDDIDADGILAFPASLASELSAFPNLALVGTPYRMDAQNAWQWAVDEQGTAEGSPVAIIYQDDEYGQDGLAGYRRAVDGLGLNSVGELTYARTDTDFTGLVRQLADEGAEYVQLTSTPSQTGPILAKAAELGFNPVWLLSTPAFDPTLLTRAQLPVEIFEDAYVVTSFAAWGEDLPGMEDFEEHVAAYAPNQEPNPFVLIGYVQARVVEATLRAAIESGDLSREGIVAAKASLEDVDMGGLLPPQTSGGREAVPSRESGVFAIDDAAPAGLTRIEDNFVSDLASEDDLS